MARSPRRTSKTPEFRNQFQRSLAGRLANVPASVQVDFIRPELTAKLEQYELIDDAVAGSIAVKKKGVKYLPMPDAGDTSPESAARYDGYKTRAVFYNVSENTLKGFVGAVFEIDPVVKVPPELDAVVKNADGSGVTLVQLAQRAESAVLSKGRAGLRVDFPKTEGPTTKAQQLDGTVRPTIHYYDGKDVINWRTITVGSKTMLSLVVLRESYETYDDGFAVQLDKQYRVLRLDNAGNFVQELWKCINGSIPQSPEYIYPVGADGAPMKEIPFTFIGSVDNSPSVDDAPMFALCDLNMAHYRNSADYEESVFVTGQTTPVITGLSKDWYETVLEKKIRFGSRGGIPLPTGATAELLQMEERSAGFAAMEHKEKQMVSLGAKLVESKQVQRTATETSADTANEKSTLRTVTDNVSAAFQFALEWAAILQGVTTVIADENTPDDATDALKFELNTDLDIATVSTEEMNSAINAWQKEAISWSEMRNKLKQGGLAHQEDKKAQAEIKSMRMDEGGTDEFGNPVQPVVNAG